MCVSWFVAPPLPVFEHQMHLNRLEIPEAHPGGHWHPGSKATPN